MNRRVYMLWVAPDVILTLLGNWRHGEFVCLPYLEECADEQGRQFAIPRDARIEQVHFSYERRSFGLMLSHDSFPEVPVGEYPQNLQYRTVTVNVMPDNMIGVDKLEPKKGELIVITIDPTTTAREDVAAAARFICERFPDVSLIFKYRDVEIAVQEPIVAAKTGD